MLAEEASLAMIFVDVCSWLALLVGYWYWLVIYFDLNQGKKDSWH